MCKCRHERLQDFQSLFNCFISERRVIVFIWQLMASDLLLVLQLFLNGALQLLVFIYLHLCSIHSVVASEEVFIG